MGQQIISDEDHDCFGKLTNQFASEGSPIFLPNISVVYFQEQIGFVLKMIIFIHGLGKCEGVGEGDIILQVQGACEGTARPRD